MSGAPWESPPLIGPQQGDDRELEAMKRTGGQIVQQLQQTVASGANNGGAQDRWAPPGPAQFQPPTSETQPQAPNGLQSAVQSQATEAKPKDLAQQKPVRPPKQPPIDYSSGESQKSDEKAQSAQPAPESPPWMQPQDPQSAGSGLNGTMNQGGSGGQHLPIGRPQQNPASRWGFGQRPAPRPVQQGYQWRGNRAWRG